MLENVSKHPFYSQFSSMFPQFEATLVLEILQYYKTSQLRSSEVLTNNNQYIDDFPIVLSGLLKVSRVDDNGNERVLYYISPRQMCAMALSCCMSKMKSNVKITAVEDTEVILIPVKHMEQWLVKYPTWRSFVMRSYKERFDEQLNLVDDLTFNSMDQQLRSYLLKYYQSSKQVIFKATHAQIAVDLSTSREVISRLLKVMQKEGKILMFRNEIDISKLIENQ